MQKRLLIGSLLALGVIGMIILDGWLSRLSPPGWHVPGTGFEAGRWFLNGTVSTLVTLAFALLAARELVNFARRLGMSPSALISQVFAAGLVIGPYAAHNLGTQRALENESWGALWLTLCLGVSFLHQAIRRGTVGVMGNLACTLFIAFYAGGLAGFITKLRMEVGGPTGVALVLVSLLVVKMTDVGAYFIGTLLGRHQMIPWLSPKKTWEGLAGGVFVAVAVAAGCGAMLENWGVSVGYSSWAPAARITTFGFVFGSLMAAFSVAGDLCASLLKREAAVKDSGDSLPGLGGVLDVLDSPLLAMPVAWFYWTRIAGLGVFN